MTDAAGAIIRDLNRTIRRQADMLGKYQSKIERQRSRINRLIATTDDCVFRIEVELLREELRDLREAANTVLINATLGEVGDDAWSALEAVLREGHAK